MDHMSDADRIVAVSLLTQAEVDALGTTLRRLYPVDDVAGFEELLNALDKAGPPSQMSRRRSGLFRDRRG
jgi:hypothetical protein